MNWLSVTLSSAEVAAGKHADLQNFFETLFMRAGTPANAAMFENSPTYENYIYYFSPGAMAFCGSPLKLLYGAADCNPPPRVGTSLVVGHHDALDRLLSDANKPGK
jgi:hypothetical protein